MNSHSNIERLHQTVPNLKFLCLIINECYAANKCPFHLSMSTSKATKHPFVNETSIQVICQYLENFRPIHLLNVLQPLTIRYHDRLV